MRTATRLIESAAHRGLPLQPAITLQPHHDTVEQFYKLVAIERKLGALERYVARHAPQRDTDAFWAFARRWKGLARRIVQRHARLDTVRTWDVVTWFLWVTAWRAGQ